MSTPIYWTLDEALAFAKAQMTAGPRTAEALRQRWRRHRLRGIPAPVPLTPADNHARRVYDAAEVRAWVEDQQTVAPHGVAQ